MPLSPVNRELVYLQVAAQLRESILEGEFAPGQQLPAERELAERLGVGRASVREALRALQAQGLVTGGRGAPARLVVAHGAAGPVSEALAHLLRLQQVSLADLVELRCVLEVAAIERARAGTPVPAAREALEQMSAPEGGVEAFHAADVRFHIAVVAAGGNQAMHLVMMSIRDAMSRYLLDALRAVPDPQLSRRRLTAQHRAILAAIESGDTGRAAELTRKHITGFYHLSLADPDKAPAGQLR